MSTSPGRTACGQRSSSTPRPIAPSAKFNVRTNSLIVIAALATQGGVDSRLPGHVRWAIEHGSSREELDALVVLLAVYAGFPRASVAMEIVRAELDLIEEEQRDSEAPSPPA